MMIGIILHVETGKSSLFMLFTWLPTYLTEGYIEVAAYWEKYVVSQFLRNLTCLLCSLKAYSNTATRKSDMTAVQTGVVKWSQGRGL